MLADSIDAREVDFSHLQFLHSRSPIIESIRSRPTLRYLFAAMAVSIFCHVLLLLLNWNVQVLPVAKPSATRLVIQLQKATPPQVNPVAETPVENQPVAVAPTEPTVDVPQVSEKELPVNPSSTAVEKPLSTKVIQPLTSEELRSVIERDDQASQSPFHAPDSGIAANVFNPALRKRLQEEESKPELQRADAGPKTYTDPSGATIVDLGGGKCLRSSVPKPGAAQNWYMTSCGGKSESEQMMERVNQEVRERFE